LPTAISSKQLVPRYSARLAVESKLYMSHTLRFTVQELKLLYA